jgi:hypothetical protein
MFSTGFYGIKNPLEGGVTFPTTILNAASVMLPAHLRWLPGPLYIKCQESFEDLFIGQVMRPAVGVADSSIQLLMRQV